MMSLSWPAGALVVDVSPRDGLQNEEANVATHDKVNLIQGLVAAGVRRVECTSFVSPKAVPKMADADAVVRRITRVPGHEYACLVANVRGMQRALDARMDVVNVVVVASETFNRRNAGMSVAESLDAITQIGREVIAAGAIPSVVVGTAFHCPFEGPTPPEAVLAIAARCAEVGIRELTIADTTGAADPSEVEHLGQLLSERWPQFALGLHLHDTRGLALANAAVGVRSGFSRFEASLGGVGGCPFSPGATGNGSTEDLVFMFESMGISTGVDLAKLIELGHQFEGILGRKLATGMLRAGQRTTVPA